MIGVVVPAADDDIEPLVDSELDFAELVMIGSLQASNFSSANNERCDFGTVFLSNEPHIRFNLR